MGIKVNQFYDNVDCPREFVCAYCGVHVHVTDFKDKRVSTVVVFVKNSTGEKNLNRMQHTKKEVVKKSLDLEIIVLKIWQLSYIKKRKKLKKWTGRKEKNEYINRKYSKKDSKYRSEI